MTTAVSSDRSPLPIAAASDGGYLRATISAPAVPAAGIAFLGKIAEALEAVVLVVFTAFLFPIAILLIGTPIALCVRVLLAIAHLL